MNRFKNASVMAAIIFAAARCSATDVSGPVSGLWTLAGSPYCIFDSVYVPSGETLIIEPGVSVYFEGPRKFSILSNAVLRACGTEEDSITFRWEPETPPVDKGYCRLRFLSASPQCSLAYCRFLDSDAGHDQQENYGGAIYCLNSSPTILNCRFHACWANYGGAIYLAWSNAYIANCKFYLSLATGTDRRGGAIYLHTSNPTLLRNQIIQNSAGTTGNGGGICCEFNSCPSIMENLIRGNSANQGGGIYFASGSLPSADFELNEISDNNASGADGKGAGIYLDGSMLTDTLTMNKNTFFADTASGLGAAGYAENLTALRMEVVNCIFWANQSSDGFQFYASGGPGSALVSYSDIQNGWLGIGNIDADPQFINPAACNLNLQEGSPCIDTGHPDPSYNDPDGTRADMGCYYYPHVGVQTPQKQALPEALEIFLPYPNPFNPSTTISYELRDASFVNLAVYDLAGHEVAQLVSGWRDAGMQEVTFDGFNLASGIYVYRLSAGDFNASGKMVLMK